jgi:hypothetical protein
MNGREGRYQAAAAQVRTCLLFETCKLLALRWGKGAAMAVAVTVSDPKGIVRLCVLL